MCSFLDLLVSFIRASCSDVEVMMVCRASPLLLTLVRGGTGSTLLLLPCIRPISALTNPSHSALMSSVLIGFVPFCISTSAFFSLSLPDWATGPDIPSADAWDSSFLTRCRSWSLWRRLTCHGNRQHLMAASTKPRIMRKPPMAMR